MTKSILPPPSSPILALYFGTICGNWPSTISVPLLPIDTMMLPPTPNSTWKLSAIFCVVIGVVFSCSARLSSCANAGVAPTSAAPSANGRRKDFIWSSLELDLANFFGQVRIGRADDGFRHGGAVHHLVRRDQELLFALRGARKRF